MESNDLSDIEYAEVGKGVKADRLLAVDVHNLRIKEGATLYRGQTDVTVTVYDIPSGGRVVYRNNIPEFAFPEHAGTPITDTSESKFRSIFLTLVANEVSGLFYPVDPTLSVARDATASRL